MIVNLAGWLYMVQAGLSLAGLLMQMSALRLLGVSYFIGSILVSAFVGIIGFGLVNRRSWGHWLALGPSLIAGTLGLLIMVLLLGATLFVYPGAPAIGQAFSGGNGAGTFVAVFLLFLMATALFSCIVNLKLFLYLIKDPAHEEFGVDSAQKGSRIATSIGAWILVVVIAGLMTGSGGLASGALSMLAARASRPDAESQSQARELARQAQRAALEREDARKHEAVLEEARRDYERAQAEEQRRVAEPDANVGPPALAPTSAENAPADSEAPAPVFGATPADDADSDSSASSKILKCRDQAGAVSYTQGYCPPGTTLVSKPKYE